MNAPYFSVDALEIWAIVKLVWKASIATFKYPYFEHFAKATREIARYLRRRIKGIMLSRCEINQLLSCLSSSILLIFHNASIPFITRRTESFSTL